jgi:hypothetical protein
LEGYVSGTPKPGTILSIVAATEPKNGRHTWGVYTPGADGDRPIGPLAILLEDALQGKTVDDAYVTGTYCRMYCCIPGDEVLLLMKNESGTADSHAIGEKVMIDDGTGKGIVTSGSVETEPFVVMETVAALTADTLVHCMFTGY